MSDFIKIVLWSLWLIPMVIVGLIFAFRGAKRSALACVISIASTLVSAVLAWGIAHLLSTICLASLTKSVNMTEVLLKLVPDLAKVGNLVDSASDLLIGILKGALSILFFGLFMLICASVLKGIVSSKVNKKTHTDLKFNWGGFFISLVDAAILISLLALPLYGTLGLTHEISKAAPSLLESIQKDDDTESAAVLDSVINHPLIVAYDSVPLANLYDIVGFSLVDDTAFSPSASVRSLADLFKTVTDCMNPETEVGINESTKQLAEQLLDNEALHPLLIELIDLAASQTSSEGTQVINILSDYISELLTSTEGKKEDRVLSLQFVCTGLLRFIQASTPKEGVENPDGQADLETVVRSAGNLLEGIIRHPAMGVDKAMELFDNLVDMMKQNESFNNVFGTEAIKESIRTILTDSLNEDFHDEPVAAGLLKLVDTYRAKFAE